jgi:hypothetical protein
MRPLTHLLVCHHTSEDPACGREQIDELYRKTGFMSLPYHFVVKRDGVVQLGRPIERAGPVDHNRAATSINVCIILPPDPSGTGEMAKYTPEQRASTETIVQHLMQKYVPIQMEVVGPLREER